MGCAESPSLAPGSHYLTRHVKHITYMLVLAALQYQWYQHHTYGRELFFKYRVKIPQVCRGSVQ